MMHHLIYLLILLFVSNCSLDTKTGFWSKSTIIKSEVEQVEKKLFVDTEIINEYKKDNNLNISQVNSISSNVAQKITNHFAHSLKDNSIPSEKSIELINKIFQL